LKELAKVLEVEQLLFMGYQPREVLADSLSAADVHVIGLARGLSGYVVPSRLYGVLAVGRPVIAAAEADSETAKVVEHVGCGVVVPPGRPELLARAIREAHDGELPLGELGRRGREWVADEGGRDVAVERYRSLLQEVTRR
jgi:glycosyltransferase involved in cell wall biosynthesis